MILLVGGYAMRWHLGDGNVTKAVANWRSHAAKGLWPLPHPSWRNTGWLKRNPWFAAELLPDLRAAIQEAVDDANAAVSKAESIRAWRLIDAQFTEDSGHMTPTLKLKRAAVTNDYATEIEALYTR